jgi:biotin-dependent carboxylase-like uncharacterized protein
MARLTVLDGGLQTLVQDRGRFGWEHLGIARGGALDDLSSTWANRLAGNGDGAAVLECLLRGMAVSPSGDVWIATAGAAEVTVNGRRYPAWAGFHVPAGSKVALGRLSGARAYLAVHGGIDVAPVLGSRSTNLEGGFGGFAGRALRRGDEIPVGNAPGTVPEGEIWRCPEIPMLQRPLTVRVLPGPRDDTWAAEAVAWLERTPFAVMPQSSHVGVRLTGEIHPAPGAGEEASQPMPVGAVQITPEGLPVVLLASRGTIGGYPVPGTVISADLWLLGQARPGDAVQFRAVGMAEAREAALAMASRKDAMSPTRIALNRRSIS